MLQQPFAFDAHRMHSQATKILARGGDLISLYWRAAGGSLRRSGPHVVYMTLAFINPVLDVAVRGKKVLDYPWWQYEDYRIEVIGEKATELHCSGLHVQSVDGDSRYSGKQRRAVPGFTEPVDREI
jgi:hypothetical protein